ncbi:MULTISPECIES: peptidoglycan-binding domain-containing protein [unclassified Clostridioides]|uniref:peptidoglycan-binding domain-containing protein n=1 Tax=unclassified Clostridioides TaxID=2635829 RepID=UPI001D11AD42|nr:peptidoglycan-binding protein [Clostridioides sp. ZZV14-6150]MCC0720972.1 peptidoglycan-binding protein [Clostridioides sp. ZZV14-6104]MCC0741219.1 peptidoglycan-binding protein [Clostridioides sp. ZZV14-6044]MCC0749400.1 peptidoglycan-binding protein [Clostridioides sp. ZZV13-5731]
MLKKSKKILVVLLCLIMLGSTTIFADSSTNNIENNESTEELTFLFKIEGYTFKYENAPQPLKDNYDKTCKELGISPDANSEIFVPIDEMQKYKQTYNFDDSIATYDIFNIYYSEEDLYFKVTGDKNYKVYITTYVGYGHQTSGNAVHLVQLLLKRCGYSLNADSSFGPDTYNKVKSFQSKYGLSADGVVGIGTWNKFVVVLSL